MKAVRIEEHGGAEKLLYGDYAEPDFGSEDLLVKVLATSVSGWDVKYRIGEWRKTLRALPGRNSFGLPMQPGRDAVGEVVRVGEKVRAFKVGDRVVGLTSPANMLSPLAIRGYGNLSTGIDVPGHTMFGSNAQFVARPEHYWLRLPQGVDPNAAAAALWSYGTAHHILADRVGARLGDTVLVTGGSGGMGSATIDLARAMGLEIVTITRDASKLQFLRDLGARDIIVLPADAESAIRDATPDALGVDAAVEYTGNEAMQRLCISVLRPGGTFVPVGGDLGAGPLPITVGDCVRLELNIHGVRGSTLNDQRIILELLAQKKIAPAIHAVMPLSEIQAAHTILESGKVTGRVILDPWA
jgi:NADPH:quinone reductase-like Zn-dependent oxidoreductase